MQIVILTENLCHSSKVINIMFTILVRNYSNSNAKVLVITKSLKRQFYLCSLFTILIDSFIS